MRQVSRWHNCRLTGDSLMRDATNVCRVPDALGNRNEDSATNQQPSRKYREPVSFKSLLHR
jgi:hypothetical protein